MPPSPPADNHHAPEIVQERAFHALVQQRAAPLLRLALHLERRGLQTPILGRSLLGGILTEATQIEELLDAYGARNNRRWHRLRHLAAMGKLFARVGYTVLHIQHRLPAYELCPDPAAKGELADFERNLLSTQIFVGNVLMQCGSRMVTTARALGLALPGEFPGESDFAEDLPPGRLPRDRTTRKVKSAEETVAHLATGFLDLASASKDLHIQRKIEPGTCGDYIPDPISEESLRLLENRFHNLQSLYDTFVLDTDTEELDGDLPRLRGHISVLYHLLRVATRLTHYYERHLMAGSGDTTTISRPLVNPADLLREIFHFAVGWSSRFLENGCRLSREMLRRYARHGRVSLPIPNYRGFHVRPSTLVSRIVHHYGSEVRMELGGEQYDASAPLDLFRANEYINARKRRRLAQIVAAVASEIAPGEERDLVSAARRIITLLAAQGRLVIYERPLPLEQLRPRQGESLVEFAQEEIARMMALGKIDVETDLRVNFSGDERVLADIKLLADNGYGEDAFGNNIPLPPKLEYLRR